MKLGIIGLPQSGKTTLFNALSGQEVSVGDYSQAVHRAVIKVPDERVEKLASLIQPKKVTHPEIEFLDAAGFTGRGKKPARETDIFHDLRMMDAVVIVVDDFSPEANPDKDFRSVIDEMILADLVMVENNVDKLERSIKLTGHRERAGELEILKRCQDTLNNEELIIELGLSEDDKKQVRGYSFLTLMPQLIAFNISEDILTEQDEISARYEKYRKEGTRDIAVICGKIEMELAVLDEEDRAEFLKELHIEEAAIDRFIRKSYALLGLISFFTMNPNECRAWTIPKGTTARQAAGVVHTDFERGFIRAEVASYEDYMEYKKPAELKAAAKVHVEGRDYLVQDGDVIQFLFNV